MPRPSVQIFQQVLNTTVVPADPEQATCIVGPAYAYFDAESEWSSNAGYQWDDSEATIPLSPFNFVAGTHELDIDSSSPYFPSIRMSSIKVLRGSAPDGAVAADGISVTGTFTASPAIGNRLSIKGTKIQQLVLDPDFLLQNNYTPAVGDVVTADVDGNGDIPYRVFAISSEGPMLEDNGGPLAALAAPVAVPFNVSIQKRSGGAPLIGVAGTLKAPAADFSEEVVVRATLGGIQVAAPIKTLGTLAIKVLADVSEVATVAVASANGGAVTPERTAGKVQITVDGVDLNVESALVHVSWRGVINNLPDIYDIGFIPENSIFENIGRINPRNPLGMAVACALSNSGGTLIKALPLSADTTAAYVGAIRKLNSAEDIYCIVPLSTDIAGVIAPYKAAAEAMSLPEKSRFRIVVAASSGVPEAAFVGPTLGQETETGRTSDGQRGFDDVNASFVTDGVVAGDKIVNSTGAVVGVVQTVVSEVGIQTVDAIAGNAEVLKYTIQRDISGNTSAQVDELKARIRSLASKRLVMVYPGSCVAMGYANQPGSMAAAALGGLLAGTPSHRPVNQVGLAGINQIFDSNLLFSDDEIDELGDNGYFVLVQDSISSAPYTVHQVTTGQISMPGVQEFSELSVVTNFDFVSSTLKARLDPFVGVWNVTPQAINSIRSSLQGGIDDLRTRTLPRIGSPLISGDVLTVQRNAADSGRLDVSIQVEIPKVLNKLVVYLTSI